MMKTAKRDERPREALPVPPAFRMRGEIRAHGKSAGFGPSIATAHRADQFGAANRRSSVPESATGCEPLERILRVDEAGPVHYLLESGIDCGHRNASLGWHPAHRNPTPMVV
jgi:hypothetical protein